MFRGGAVRKPSWCCVFVLEAKRCVWEHKTKTRNHECLEEQWKTQTAEHLCLKSRAMKRRLSDSPEAQHKYRIPPVFPSALESIILPLKHTYMPVFHTYRHRKINPWVLKWICIRGGEWMQMFASSVTMKQTRGNGEGDWNATNNTT